MLAALLLALAGPPQTEPMPQANDYRLAQNWRIHIRPQGQACFGNCRIEMSSRVRRRRASRRLISG